MPCPAEIYSGTRENDRPWRNWLGNVNYVVPGYFRPSNLRDLVWILAQAQAEGRKVKAVGRGWSFEDCAVSEDWVVDVGALDNTIPFLTDPATGSAILAPQWRERQFGASSEKLYHVEAGIRIFDLNRRLEAEGLAMLTLGGSQGQTLAGAISTSTHGSNLDQPALPGVVQAIHLVTTGGQEVWIESISEPLTAGDEVLRAQLGCADLQVVRDDELLRAARVTLGRLGVIYSYVIKVTQAFRLAEWTEELTWASVSDALAAGVGQTSAVAVRAHLGGLAALLSDPPGDLAISTGAGDFNFLDILLNANLKARHGDEVCWVRRRWPTDSADDLNLNASQNPLCHHGVASVILTVAGAALATYAGNVALIPIYGTAKAIAIGVDVTRLNALAHDPHITGGEALAEAVNAVWRAQIGHELEWLIAELNHTVLGNGLGASREDGIRGASWQVLSGLTEGTTGDCYRANSSEFIFDTRTRAYVDFVNRLLDAAGDFRTAGYISLRFSRSTDAYLSMHNVGTPLAVSIEVSSLYGLEDNEGWIAFAETTAKDLGGRPHWGQQNRMSALDLVKLYDATHIRQWKEQCLRMVGPYSATFSNRYTRQRGLEPMAVARAVTHTRKTNGTVTHLCTPGQWWSPLAIDEAIGHTAAGVCRYQTLPAQGGAPNGFLRLRRYLATAAGGGRQDNLDALPRRAMRPPAPPPEDRRRLRITSVVQGRNALAAIRLVCNDAENWAVLVDDAWQQIAAGRREFYVVDPRSGEERTVMIRQYLSTDADAFTANNLDNLPPC